MKKACIFDRHGKPTAEQRQDILLVASKVVQVAALDVENANALSLKHQGYGEFRAHAVDGVDVARVLCGIAHANGMACCRRSPCNSLPNWNPQIVRQLARVSDRETVLEIGSISFDHQDAEDLVVDVPLDEGCRARQNLVEVQRRIHFFADFSEGGENFGRDLPASVQLRCFRVGACLIHDVCLL